MTAHTDWQEDDQNEMSAQRPGVDILALILRRKWLLVVGVVVGLGLGYLHFTRQMPIYRSSAQLLIIKKETRFPSEGFETRFGYEDLVYGGILSTQMMLIRSPLIIERAVKEHRLETLRSFAGGGNPTYSIIAGLVITKGGNNDARDAHVLNVHFQGPDPEDCATVLNAVVESYQDFLGETYENVSAETIQLITQAKDELRKQLTEKEATYREFRGSAPLLWLGRDQKGRNIHEARVIDIESARSAIQLSRAERIAQLRSIEEALASASDDKTAPVNVQTAGGTLDAPLSRSPSPMQENLLSLLAEEERLLKSFASDHPKVQAVHQKVQNIRSVSSNMLAVRLESLRQEIKELEERERELTKLFEREREEARELLAHELNDENFRKDIARTQQLFDAVIQRLQEINLVKDYGGYSTQVISPAGRGQRVEPNLPRVMALAAFLGLLGGFGLMYVVDVADNRFRSPDEIRRRLRLPVVGHIPHLFIDNGKSTESQDVDKQSKVHSIVCALHQPKSHQAEAYRVVRTALYFSTRVNGQKVIQITSPNAGDGKTTLAANLGVCIAHSGKKVLLIDADFRRTRLHKLFSVDMTIGLSSAISGGVELPGAIQSTEVENLWVLPGGPKPPNPAELLTSPRFKQLVDLVSKEYDFVLLDSPPLLAVTDPCAIAPRVDGVLLIIRMTKSVRPDAVRSTEVLANVGAHMLGVVVNAVDRQPGYGYAGYRYGYRSYYSGYYGGYRYDGYGYDDVHCDGDDDEEDGRNDAEDVPQSQSHADRPGSRSSDGPGQSGDRKKDGTLQRTKGGRKRTKARHGLFDWFRTLIPLKMSDHQWRKRR